MGILDEAIREHLELKRQHGASETEVKDLEDEAFGPASRPEEPEAVPSEDSPLPPAEAETPAPAAAEPATPRPEAEAEPAPPPAEIAEPPAEEPEPTPAPEVAPEEARGEDSVVDQPTELYDVEGELSEEVGSDLEDAGEEGFFSEQSLSDELDSALGEPDLETPAAPEPGPEPEQQSAPPPQPPAPETEEHPAETEGAPFDQEEESEDVLEETPEFLQDTPEHDRLWFEQKPPKDFDFDD
jgi:hypothetical protein